MNDSDRHSGITGIILAGGAGSRMGGADKGLLGLQNRPLIEHVLIRVESQVDQLILVANRNLDTYREYGHPVVGDPLPGHPGPLVGMLAGLSACTTSHALFMPADAVHLPHDLAARLKVSSLSTPVVAADAVGWQPLCCLLPLSLLPCLNTAVNAGERSPRRWLEALSPEVVMFKEPDLVWSVNTAEELARLEQHPGLAA